MDPSLLEEFKTAVNLEEINRAINSERLRKIPEGRWVCVKNFIYNYHSTSDSEIKLLSQFLSKRPALKKLQLNCAPFFRATADDPIFLELMQLSLMTLEDFHIRSSADVFDPVGSVDVIGLPQLPKLRVLRLHMTSSFGQAIEKAQSLLNQHDGQVFSQLEEFHLSVDTIDERYGFRLRAALEIRPCFSVSKLRLELDPLSSSFVEANCLFPAVTDMHIVSQWYVEPTRLPYQQIFRLWQNLETLSIENEDFHSSYNLDSDFCGLHEEEVEYLRGKGDKFLGAIQLVPIAPCVLTMRHLVKFTMECPPGLEVSEKGTYMTKVSRVLAQRYLPQTLVKVTRGAD